jgi:hypothetical protein
MFECQQEFLVIRRYTSGYHGFVRDLYNMRKRQRKGFESLGSHIVNDIFDYWQ